MEAKNIKDAMEGIGLRVRECRKRMRFTQKQLAAMIDRTESAVNKYERGVIEIPLAVLHNIAKALEVNENYLLFGQTASADNSIASIAKTEEGTYLFSRGLMDSFKKRPANERKGIVDALRVLQENQDAYLILTSALEDATVGVSYFEDKHYMRNLLLLFGDYLSYLDKYDLTDEDAAMLVQVFSKARQIMDRMEE